MEDQSLAEEAETAVALFKRATSIRDLFELLHPGTDTEALFTALDDQFGRFNIFASNIGIFAKDHASLDWRLRGSEDATKATGSILQSLQWFLQQAIETFSVQVSDGALSLQGLDIGEDDGESLTAESYFVSETSKALTDDMQPTEPVTPASTHVCGIEETIDRLYRLSLLIRNPSASSQNSKAAGAQILDDEGNDAEAAFQDYASKVVKHRCPDISRELLQRMSKSITLRRKRFLYRKRHQAKLSFGSSGSGAHVLSTTANATPTASIILGHQTLPEDGATGPRQAFRGFEALSATTATILSAAKFPKARFLGAESVISTAISTIDHQGDPFQPPPPPKTAPKAKEFECPYCYMIMPVKEARSSLWKQHFLKDLDPYVCIFPHCEEPNLMFSDVKGWLDHMQWAHTHQWCCRTSTHGKVYFNSESDFEVHMHLTHEGAFAASQLPVLTKRALVPGVALASCPFCNACSPTSGKSPREIAMHVADHLRHLALISLPMEDDNSEAEGDGTGSHKANESSADVEGVLRDDISLDFSEVLDSAPHSGLGTLPDSEDPTLVPGEVECFDPEEWSFLEIQDDYVGHPRDPILQTFLRKLYVDSSHMITATRGPLLPCWIMPFNKNKRFFARASPIAKIEESLLPYDRESNLRPSRATSNPRTFVIHGPGGMGKSQVAAEFVYRHQDEFDAVLWAHADDSSKLLLDFNVMAIKLGLVVEDSADSRDFIFTRELVKRWLVEPLRDLKDPNSKKASWLLIFDAVEDATLLDDFWPFGGPGSILITSRSTFGWTSSLLLAPFSVDEASSYLLATTGRDKGEESPSDVAKVARKLGGLPLALTQMAGVISTGAMAFADFERAYNERESRQRLLTAKPSPGLQSSDYEYSIASVFALEHLRHGSVMLDICAMLDPDGISERIFLDNFDKIHLVGLPTSMAEYQQAKVELLRSSILISDKGSGKLIVHRLVQDVARMRLTPEALRDIFMACIKLISGIWPFQQFGWRHSIERWQICEELSPHVVRLRDLADQLDLSPSTEDAEGDYDVSRLFVDAGWYHHERGQSIDAEVFNDVTKRICDTWLQRERHDSRSMRSDNRVHKLETILSEITHNRGCIAVESNQPDVASKHLEAFHQAMQRDFNAAPHLMKHDMRLAISWNEIGNAHMLKRRWKAGEECFEKSIETLRLVEPFRPTEMSLPLVNLGLSYWLQNRLEEALEVLRTGLKVREEAFGVDDRVSFITGRYLHAIGNVLGTMGEREQSQDYHRKALLHYKNTLGTGHHRTADLYVKVAEHSIMVEPDENALILLDHALKTYNDRDSADLKTLYIPERIRAMWLRGRVLQHLSRFKEAKLEKEKALQLLRQITEASPEDPVVELTDSTIDDQVAFWSR